MDGCRTHRTSLRGILPDSMTRLSLTDILPFFRLVRVQLMPGGT